jgi:hypothetical protein
MRRVDAAGAAAAVGQGPSLLPTGTVPVDVKEVFGCCSVVMQLLEEQCWDGVSPLALPHDDMFELANAAACMQQKQEFGAAVFEKALQICKAVY